MAGRRETALRLHEADIAVLKDEATPREAQGRAEGQGLMLRRFIVSELTRRGLNVTVELRERLEACEDVAALEALLVSRSSRTGDPGSVRLKRALGDYVC